jgi:hypothetical protein
MATALQVRVVAVGTITTPSLLIQATQYWLQLVDPAEVAVAVPAEVADQLAQDTQRQSTENI